MSAMKKGCQGESVCAEVECERIWEDLEIDGKRVCMCV